MVILNHLRSWTIRVRGAAAPGTGLPGQSTRAGRKWSGPCGWWPAASVMAPGSPAGCQRVRDRAKPPPAADLVGRADRTRTAASRHGRRGGAVQRRHRRAAGAQPGHRETTMSTGQDEGSGARDRAHLVVCRLRVGMSRPGWAKTREKRYRDRGRNGAPAPWPTTRTGSSAGRSGRDNADGNQSSSARRAGGQVYGPGDTQLTARTT